MPIFGEDAERHCQDLESQLAEARADAAAAKAVVFEQESEIARLKSEHLKFVEEHNFGAFQNLVAVTKCAGTRAENAEAENKELKERLNKYEQWCLEDNDKIIQLEALLEEVENSNRYLYKRCETLANEKIKLLAACKSLYKRWKVLSSIVNRIPYLPGFLH